MVCSIIFLHFRATQTHDTQPSQWGRKSDRECVSGTFLRVTAQIRAAWRRLHRPHNVQLKVQQNHGADISLWIMPHLLCEIFFFSSAAADWSLSFTLGHNHKELAPFFCSSLTSNEQLQLSHSQQPSYRHWWGLGEGCEGGGGIIPRTRILAMIYTFPACFDLHRMTPKLGDQSHFKECYRWRHGGASAVKWT